MQTIVAIFLVTLAAANAGHYGGSLVGPANPGAVIAGPSAKGSVVGPDGSHVVGGAHGGVVNAAPIPGGVVSGAVSPGHVAVGGVGLVAPIAPLAHGALGHAGGAVIAGPSGTVYGHAVGGHYAGGLGLGLGLGGLGLGAGHDGGYVPDISEHLYDDGSYRPEHHYSLH
ncbi:uncharacterized protein [Onthophagus taurus]|uniref:uncharacterized protein n=1 Tax=Onthophagus taurus TaxID=166361 RepID=UPI0039BEAB8E